MRALQSKEAIEQRNIANLAKEFALSIAEVGALYEIQRERLMKGAKVGKYFSIVAVRNIRQQLAQKRTSLF
jgi:uncharacterized protein YlxP (DUF503 family)